MSDDNTVYVGIDLGTTYSCVMEYDPKGSFIEYRSVKNELSIPSVVKISPNSCNVGTTALNSVSDTDNVIHEVKRLMGKNYDEEDKKLMEIVSKMPNKIVSTTDQRVGIEVVISQKKGQKESATFLPEQVSALVLLKLKENVQLKHGKNCNIKAVVGVPAVFGDAEKQATINAMNIAGIEMLDMVNEPSAAAKTYNMNDDGLLFVFDFGGGTLDISIVQVKNGDKKVIATGGDSFLGGKNIDYNIAPFVKEEILRIAEEELMMSGQELEKFKTYLEKKRRAIVEFSEILKKEL